MTALLACPGCGDLIDKGYKWCPSCGKWLRLVGPTASDLHYRRKDSLQAAPRREDSPPHKERMI